MFLMPVQLETRRKCLTTFCNRLFPSVLKTADDLMQIVIVFLHNLPAIFFYIVLAFGSLSCICFRNAPARTGFLLWPLCVLKHPAFPMVQTLIFLNLSAFNLIGLFLFSTSEPGLEIYTFWSKRFK